MSTIPRRQWLLLTTLLQAAAAPDTAPPGLQQLKQKAQQLWADARLQSAPGELVGTLKEQDLPPVLRQRLDEAEQWCERSGCSVLTRESPDYPPLLAAIPDPPAVLFLHGDPAVLGQPQLAMVGTRKPSNAGKRLAGRFAAALCQAGYAITSGLALGIDAASHQGALDAGGATVAVLGTGLDRLYPARNATLAKAISERGVLVSELLPGSGPLAWHFPRRNRIISGLSHGVLVVEAALNSGSLITARMAGEQGREIFAVPGPVEQPQSRGCHRLLRQGAVLVEEVGDILTELGGLLQWEQGRCAAPALPSGSAVPLPDSQRQLLQLLAYQPLGLDELVRDSGLAVEALLPQLLQLELAGHLECRGGRYQCV